MHFPSYIAASLTFKKKLSSSCAHFSLLFIISSIYTLTLAFASISKLKSKQHRQWFSTMRTSYRYERYTPIATCVLCIIWWSFVAFFTWIVVVSLNFLICHRWNCLSSGKILNTKNLVERNGSVRVEMTLTIFFLKFLISGEWNALKSSIHFYFVQNLNLLLTIFFPFFFPFRITHATKKYYIGMVLNTR